MDFDRSLANERIEDLRREVRMWRLEKWLRASPERGSVVLRIAALLGGRSARKWAAVGSNNEIEESRSDKRCPPTADRDPLSGSLFISRPSSSHASDPMVTSRTEGG